MDKWWYKRTYIACGKPIKVTILKKGYGDREQQVRNAVDAKLREKVQTRTRCSLCQNHNTGKDCDCIHRYCTPNSRRSNSDRRTGKGCKPRVGAKSRNLGRVSTSSGGSDNAPKSSNKQSRRKSPGRKRSVPEKKRSVPEKKSSVPERKSSVPEKKSSVPEKKSFVPERKGFVPKVQWDPIHLAPVRKPDKSEGGEKDTRLCICGRPGVGPSRHHCDHITTDDEEEFENFRNLEEFSVPYVFDEENEWKMERANNFTIGDVLKVHFPSRENVEYCWMRLFENFPLYEKLQKYLKEKHKKTPLEAPDINSLFLIEHEGEWYRGKIVAVRPERLVRCVDTGVTFPASSLEYKKLEPNIANLAPLAVRVIYPDDVKVQEEDAGPVEVKVVGVKMRGIYEVRLLSVWKSQNGDRNQRMKLVRKVQASRRNVLASVKEGMTGFFATTQVQDNVVIGCLVPDDLENAVHSFRHVKEMHCLDGEEIEAEVGDFVLVGKEGRTGWRGIVKSKSQDYGYEVILVDMGFAVFSKSVFTMPKLKSDLLDLASQITVTFKDSKLFPLNPRTNYYFEVKEQIAAERWLCSLKIDYEDEEFPCQGILERADEAAHRIMYVPFESGCSVKISALSQDKSDIILYVRRADDVYEDQFEVVTKAMNTKTSRSSERKFWEEVQAGDIAGAKYDDGLYYRALVLSRNGGRIGVRFLDYGNEKVLKVSDLRRLPYHIIEEPRFARRITLLESDNPVSSGGFPYLEALMEKCELLTLRYTGDITDGVLLLEKKDDVYDQEAINREMSYSDTFTKNFFRQCKFSTGIVQDFVVLYVNKEEFEEGTVFWAANPNNDYCGRSLEETNRKIGEYCRAVRSEHSPRDRELCFALFEGEWFRALAKRANDDGFEIFFIDYGNTAFLRPESIRKMNPKYFEAPPLAMRCVLEGFDDFGKQEIDLAYRYLKRKMHDSVGMVKIVNVEQFASVVFIPEFCELLADVKAN